MSMLDIQNRGAQAKSTDKRVSIRVDSQFFSKLRLDQEKVLFKRLVGISNADIDQMLVYLIER